MVTKRFSVLFRLKKPANYEKGNMPIYMRITVDSERTELSIKREFDPARWNKKLGRAVGTKEDALTLNSYLDTLRTKVHQAQSELLVKEEIVIAERIKNKLQGKGERSRVLLDIFTLHNMEMEKLIATGRICSGTLTHFETTYKLIRPFLVWKYEEFKNIPIDKVDIPINKIDYSFYQRFEMLSKGGSVRT